MTFFVESKIVILAGRARTSNAAAPSRMVSINFLLLDLYFLLHGIDRFLIETPEKLLAVALSHHPVDRKGSIGSIEIELDALDRRRGPIGHVLSSASDPFVEGIS